MDSLNGLLRNQFELCDNSEKTCPNELSDISKYGWQHAGGAPKKISTMFVSATYSISQKIIKCHYSDKHHHTFSLHKTVYSTMTPPATPPWIKTPIFDTYTCVGHTILECPFSK